MDLPFRRRGRAAKHNVFLTKATRIFLFILSQLLALVKGLFHGGADGREGLQRGIFEQFVKLLGAVLPGNGGAWYHTYNSFAISFCSGAGPGSGLRRRGRPILFLEVTIMSKFSVRKPLTVFVAVLAVIILGVVFKGQGKRERHHHFIYE